MSAQAFTIGLLSCRFFSSSFFSTSLAELPLSCSPSRLFSVCAHMYCQDSIHDGGAERLQLVVLTTGLGGMNEQVVVFALLVAVMIRSLRETNGLAYMTGLSCLCACSLLPLRPCSLLPLRPCNRPPESVLSCSATVHYISFRCTRQCVHRHALVWLVFMWHDVA